MSWFKRKSSKNRPIRPYTEARYGSTYRPFLYAILVFVGAILLPIALVQGAPVIFTQSDWAQDPNPSSFAAAPFSSWIEYSDKDTGVVSGTDIHLESVNFILTQTSDDGSDDTCAALGCSTGGGFGVGIFTNTALSGRGSDARVHLATKPWFTDWSTRYLGGYSTGGVSKNVTVVGNYAYVADEGAGLKIFDIQNPASPTHEGTYSVSGNAYGVAVVGNTAYVAYGSTGLEIVNISDKASPARIGGFNTDGIARDLVVVSNFAYVADDASGLQIINISTPSAPTLTGTFDTPGTAYDVVVNGTVAHVADGASGLRIVNVGNPASPQSLGTYDTSGFAYDLDVAGNFVYVADNDYGLQIINVSTPGSPTLTGAFDTAGNAYCVTVVSDTAYVADDTHGLHIFDVKAPASPKRIGTYNTPGNAYGATVVADRAYVADGASGFHILDVAKPIAFPELKGEYDTSGTANGVVVAKDHAYVLDAASDMHIFDVRTPSVPVFKGTYSGLAGPEDIAVKGNHVYVADGSAGLKIIDIFDPAAPTLKATLDTSGTAKGVSVAGNHAYVADDADGLAIIDITDPASPTLAATYDTAGNALALTVTGSTAYIADGTSGLQIIDVSNPATPTLTATYATSSAHDVAVAGNHAYVADDTSGLQIIDISAPATPTLVSTYATAGSARKVHVREDYAYVTNDSSVLYIINISVPSAPVLAAVYDSAGLLKDIHIDGNYAYVTDDAQGLRIIRITEYELSGTYESPAMDLGGAQNFLDLSWLPSSLLPATNLTMEVRAGPGNDCPGSCTGWTGWTPVTNAADSGTAFDDNQYVQYKAALSTTNPLITPRLDEVSLQFSNYPVGAALVSSVFDTGNANNFLKTVSWAESVSGSTDVRLQIATSGNNINWEYCGSDACSSSDWLAWDNANNYYDSGNLTHLNSSDAASDRYFKYKVWLVSGGTSTPALDDLNITFDTADLKVFAPDGTSTTHVPTAGTPFNVIVKVQDSSGSAVNDHDGSRTVKLKASAPQPDRGSCASSFTSANNTEFSTAGTYSGGAMTISVTLCDASAASFTISAQETSNGALTSTSDLTISSVDLDAPLQLGFGVHPPPTPAASADFNPLPVVHIQDQYGNIDLNDNTTAVTLSAHSDIGCSSTPATGTFNAAYVSTVNGVVTFSGVNYNKEEVIYIKAEASGLADACSTAVTVVSTGFVVQLDPAYDSVNDAILVTTSLLRNGSLVADNANMALTALSVLDDDGTDLSGDLSGSGTTVTDATNSVFHTTWDPAAGLDRDKAYSIVSEVTYDGTVYPGFKVFSVNQLAAVASTLDEVKVKADSIQNTVTDIDTKAGQVSANVLSLDNKLTGYAASQAAYRAQTLASLQTLETNIGSILEDTATTIPDLLKTNIAAELAKGEHTEIVTTQAVVKTGTTLPFRFRTASGLAPKVTVLDPKETVRVNAATMKEIGGTGIYQYKIAFSTDWGLGNFMVRVDEATKQSVDNMALRVVEAQEKSTAASSASSASAITLDTLYSRINNINSNMDTLATGIDTVKGNTDNVSTDINDLLEKVKGGASTAAVTGAAEKVQKLSEHLNAVSSMIGTSGSSTDYRTILGKLNGIENVLTQMGTDADAAMNFNENARIKAEKIRKYVLHIMTEYKKEGVIEDPEAKAEVLEEYLTELKETVTEIPASLTTENITSSVEYTLSELDAVTEQNENLKELVPLVQQDLEITETKSAADLTPKDMLDMRNDVSGLKSLMVEIRGLLDTNVNKPVVHGWLEGN